MDQRCYCPDNVDIKNKGVDIYSASVSKMVQGITNLPLFHCRATEISLTCKESFLGRLDTIEKAGLDNKINVTLDQCIQAVSTGVSPYGKLIQKNPNLWQTETKTHYKCR